MLVIGEDVFGRGPSVSSSLSNRVQRATVPPLPTVTPVLEDRVFTRIAWRLMPLLIVAYVLNYLDRNNLGFAALTMNRELGLTATQFGRAAGILFLGYCFFEVPSNIALYRVGPRVWLARIMISWGLISAGTIFVTGSMSLYLLRFLLGVAEAGFSGVAFYLGTWFPSAYRTRMIAWFMRWRCRSSVVAGPCVRLALQMDGVASVSGWKWLFLPRRAAGGAARQRCCRALRSAGDRDMAVRRGRRVVSDRIRTERRGKRSAPSRRRAPGCAGLILAGVQFGFLVGPTAWDSSCRRSSSSKLSDLEVGFVSSGCYVVATVGMIIWAGQVDKRVTGSSTSPWPA